MIKQTGGRHMIIGKVGDYKIVKEQVRNSYIVVNTKGKYKNHEHFKKLSTCYLMIDLLQKKKVPKSDYLLEAAIRITTDEQYKAQLLHIQENRHNKQMYYNVNKGVKKR